MMGEPDLAAGLSRWLTEYRGAPVEAKNLEHISAGARRINVLFDAVNADGSVDRLAVTALPTLDIQIMPMTAEAGIRSVAYDAGVPTPRILGSTNDPSYIGGPFFISERVDGETIPRRVLRLVEQRGIGPLIGAQLGTAIASLHSIDPAAAPPDLPRITTPPIETALINADAGMSTLLQPSPVFAYGMRWLENHRPSEPERITIVHTDIRNGNVIIGEDGLRGILDWEGTRTGDPAEDLAWPTVRMWRFRNDHLLVGGFCGIEPYRSAYAASGGDWDDDRVRWWRALGTLRWGLGLAGQANAHLDGRFRSIVMAASGRRVAELEYDTLISMRG
jgi:aminoglycoside phosphotransferase (APT) family kinase protein